MQKCLKDYRMINISFAFVAPDRKIAKAECHWVLSFLIVS